MIDGEGQIRGIPKTGSTQRPRRHLAFEIGIILKGVNALFECVAGLALLFIPGSAFTSLVTALTQHELAEDPRDFVATHLLSWAQGFSSAQAQYYAIYLLSHGVIKLALVAALLRGLLWAYPVSIVVLLGFVFYQLYRFSFTHSWGLMALTLFDLVVIALIVREYLSQRRDTP